MRGGVVRTERSGRFTVATASPASGSKPLRIEATRPGRRPWRFDVTVKRGVPDRVRVAERDDEAPSAALSLSRPGEAAAAVQPSPSRAGEEAAVTVPLTEPRFVATAAVRDPEGGTGRIRISVKSHVRCGDRTKTRVQVIPPAQIENIALPPGRLASIERQRSERIELDAPAGCDVSGEVLAEGTDAHGRQAVTPTSPSSTRRRAEHAARGVRSGDAAAVTGIR